MLHGWLRLAVIRKLDGICISAPINVKAEHYVTLFDETFLPQGLALHASLSRHSSGAVLWIICLTDVVCEQLSMLGLCGVNLINLKDIECSRLRAARAERSWVEYCWTLTPFVATAVFERCPDADRVTYVDADLWFRANPEHILGDFEASGKSVLITEHGYAPSYDQTESAGKYCVQFVTFKRTGSREILERWQNQCLDWCYARHENGRFGDQKYLEEWPVYFPHDVYILQNRALVMGPWSATRFPYSESVCWHFHAVRLVIKKGDIKSMWTGAYMLPQPVKTHVYQPYLKDLKAAAFLLKSKNGYSAPSQPYPSLVRRTGYYVRRMYRGVRDWAATNEMT